MTRHLLSNILHVEVAYHKRKEKLRDAHRMAHYKINTMRWKIKNDLDLWERIETYKIIQSINKNNYK